MFANNLFKDKKVLVTGGGSGIGFAIAKQYLQLGAKVCIAARKEEKLSHACQMLQEYGEVFYKILDIRDLDQIEETMQAIKARWGGLDILVNNAGGQFPSPAADISPKGWNAVINNNLNGTWYVTQAAAKHFFIPQQSGNIINIIVNIFRGFPGMAHSSAARAGVDNLTKSLAVEWVPHHIRINAIAPGIIASSGLDNYPPELLQGISSQIPMKRLGTSEEVADACMFLSSPLASYITGETLYVDGGWRLWGNTWQIPD